MTPKRGRNASRHSARETAVQILYGLSFIPAENEEALRRAFTDSPRGADGREKTASGAQEFAWELVAGVWRNSAAIDEAISRFSQNWRMNRIGCVELTLLRLAAYELLFSNEAPPKVVISEALELTEQFGEEGSKKFINGILDAMFKAVEAGDRDKQAQTR